MLQAAVQAMHIRVFGGAGDRPNVPNVGILVSDGYTTVNANRTLPAAQAAKADNITMLAVVVNADNNIVDMTAIASDPERPDLFLLTSSNMLDEAVGMALDRLCVV